jgi:hypothetical protein
MVTRINLLFAALLRIPIVNVFALLAYIPVIIVVIFATAIYNIVISVISITNSVNIIKATKVSSGRCWKNIGYWRRI